MERLTVVIPTFNEEKTIGQTLSNVFASLRGIKMSSEVIIVDDSKDDTYNILKKLSKKYKQLRVMHREKGKGVGSAIRKGIDEAKGSYIIVFMADSPQDAKYFSLMASKLKEGYDIVQTSRFMKGCKIVNYPLKKRISNWLCNNFIRLVFLEFKLKDFSSLFKGFNKEKINALNLDANEFDLGLEIILKSMRKKYKITEIPVDWVERERGESKLKLSKYAKHYLKRTFGIWLFYWK